jgi:hypothetical protein
LIGSTADPTYRADRRRSRLQESFFSGVRGISGVFYLSRGRGFCPGGEFFPTERPYINWRTFSLTLFFILLVSLLWEATLVIPYQWWDYQPNQMVGIRIGARSGLPIEAVCVWVFVTYATAIVFEIVKLWQASERPAKDALLGSKNYLKNPPFGTNINNAITKVKMNEITNKDISGPEELNPEEMSALTGGAGFRYEPPDPC